MNNYRNNRKNRFKSNSDRSFRKRTLNGHKNQIDFNSNSDFKHRNPGRNNQNAAKLVDKYNNLAREALSSGDKIMSENYMQHADHFSRVLIIQEISKVSSNANNVIEQNFSKNDNELESNKNENIVINNNNNFTFMTKESIDNKLLKTIKFVIGLVQINKAPIIKTNTIIY